MKVLAVDIETTPLITYTWGLFNQNIGINQIEKPTEVLCFAARWLGKPKNSIEFYSSHKDGQHPMLDHAWDLIDEADAVLHFNGKSFDMKHFNREFIVGGWNPPSPVIQIDLLSAVRKIARFPSNKLQYVSQVLGIGEKMPHEGFDLWLRCMAGEEGAWSRMERYNKQDVHLLVDLYHRLLPWLPGLPNNNLFNGTGGCPRFGCTGTADDLKLNGFRRTQVGKFQTYECRKCGGYSTSGKSVERTDLRSTS